MEKAVLPDELRCIRTDGRTWRCKKPRVDGSKYCENHTYRSWDQRKRRKDQAKRHIETNDDEKRKNARVEDSVPSQSDEAEEVCNVRACIVAETDKHVVDLQNVDDLQNLTDTVTDLLSTDGCRNQIDTCKSTKTSEETAETHQKTVTMTAPEKWDGEKARNGNEEVGSEVLGGFKFLRRTVEFKDITSLESFTIVVNGLIIDSELSEQARGKYFELCCSQRAFLHDNLCKTINCKLAAGVISQTINIADQIRDCKLTTCLDEFAEWDNILKAFEQLGMNVGFLRVRVKKLLSLVRESEKRVDSQKYREAIEEIDNAEEEAVTLKQKLVELEDTSKKLECEIESLEDKTEEYKLKFEVEVDAPWDKFNS